MKIIKIALFIITLLCSSYASLWIGFSKGYEYNLGQNLADSAFTIRIINLVKNGETVKAINSLEQELDGQILERTIADKEFIKYIIGMPRSDKDVIKRLEARVIKHRQLSDYKCMASKEACEIVNDFINKWANP